MIIPASISEKSFKFGTVPFTFLVSEGIPPIIILGRLVLLLQVLCLDLFLLFLQILLQRILLLIRLKIGMQSIRQIGE